MTRVTLSIRKTLDQSATEHFALAKKARSKMSGVRETLARFEAQEVVENSKKKSTNRALIKKREWYEGFRWTFTTDGNLVIAGKDASTNETLIKKYTLPGDIVLHTDTPGSPFTIIKKETSKEAISEASIGEAAQFCACYSKAWKAGLGVADVYWVKPEQLSKTPNTGEFVGKGSFIVRGEKNYLSPPVLLAIGLLSGKPAAGVATLFAMRGEGYAVLSPGKETTSDITKKLVKKIGFTPDAWNSLIPAGGCVITAWHKQANDKIADEEQNGTNKNASMTKETETLR